VAQAVAALAAGSVNVEPQEQARVTRAPKLRKEDGLINWTEPARAIHNLVRAMQPWPTAQTTWQARSTPTAASDPGLLHKTHVSIGAGEPGEVLEAAGDRLLVAAGEGAIAVATIQLPGKKALSAAEFLRGRRVQPGDWMGR